jgi:hypothetical protein
MVAAAKTQVEDESPSEKSGSTHPARRYETKILASTQEALHLRRCVCATHAPFASGMATSEESRCRRAPLVAAVLASAVLGAFCTAWHAGLPHEPPVALSGGARRLASRTLGDDATETTVVDDEVTAPLAAPGVGACAAQAGRDGR